MPATDLLISAKIRAILASHWIDAEKLQFRTASGTVRFYGVLARQGSFGLCDVGTAFVEVLLAEIQRTPGVQKVYFTGVEIEHHKRLGITEDDEILSCEGTCPREPQTTGTKPNPSVSNRAPSGSDRTAGGRTGVDSQ